jgi:hypothetical protein
MSQPLCCFVVVVIAIGFDVSLAVNTQALDQWRALTFASVMNLFNANSQKFVEFFDSRACARAFHEAQGAAFRHGSIDCKFAWDHYRP